VLAWLVFTLVVTALVLAVAGVPLRTVAGLVAAGAAVGGVLLVAVRLSPPAAGPDVTRGDGAGS